MIREALVWLTVVCLTQGLEESSENTIRSNEYEYYPGFGYYYVSEHSYTNWTNGYSLCQSPGTDLVVINSHAEARVIKQFLESHKVLEAFVGVSDILALGELVTVTGEPLDRAGFKVWLGGDPGPDPTRRCVAYNRNASGGLVKVDCNKSQYYMCKRQLWRKDYVLVPGFGYYKLNTTGVIWADAWKTCRAEGANLAVINSIEELAVLQDIIRKYPDLPNADSNSLFHIGLHAQYGMGSFVTIDGIPAKRSGFNQWEPGHPTFYATYARLVRDATLDSTQVRSRLAFICEHALA